MHFGTSVGKPQDQSAYTLIYLVFESEKPTAPLLKELDNALGGIISGIYSSGEFSGAANASAVLRRPTGWKISTIVLVGLGQKSKVSAESYRQAAGIVSRTKVVENSGKVVFDCQQALNADSACALIEGYQLGRWKMTEYKTGDDAKPRKEQTVLFAAKNRADATKLHKGITRGQIVADSVLTCRRLQEIPSNDLTPTALAKEATALSKKSGFTIKVLDEKQIAAEKMGAFLAVNQGSATPPRFLIMKYNGAPKGSKPVVLVGKGVTFDTGGISLKPGANMHEMKADMTGAAVVISTMAAVSRLKLKLNVVGLVPSTDNMPSSHAYKPGDIIKSRKGKTIEIINTDAEGRLLLADALDYANEFKPQAVIDIATLTGATLFILGYAGAPIVGVSKQILDQLRKASASTCEKVWELPLWPEHLQQMKSNIADLVNSGGRPAGTLTAAAFLHEFIGDYPWAHIDIAYVDQEPSGTAYTPRGASGFGTRLLIETLSNWKKVTA